MAHDAPFWHPTTVFRQRMQMTHGWDGELGRYFLVEVDGAERPVGLVGLYTSDYDNLDQAWVEMAVQRRPPPAGDRHGRPACSRSTRLDAMGRTKVGWFGWDNEQTRGFAAATGFEPKSVAVLRRQHLHELEAGLADRLYAEAVPHARDYELVRITVPTPEELLPALAAATAAINDAPAGRPRARGRGVHTRAHPGLRDGPPRQRLPRLPGPRPPSRDPGSWPA